MPNPKPFHRLTVTAKDGRVIYGAAGLLGLTPKAYLEQQLEPVARQIVEQGRPLHDLAIFSEPLDEAGKKWLSVEPALLDLINQAIAVERRYRRDKKRPGRFQGKQFVEKYLLPHSYEVIKKFASEVEESQKKAA